MKEVLIFLAGAIVGAAVALMYAPESGEELRAELKSQADAQYKRMQDEWEKGKAEMQTRMDQMSGELKDVAKRAQSEA